MRKKAIGLTIAGLVALSGVVSAASVWGTYKGNDIVRITVNGSPARISDVPAISYNNRTMVPINLLTQFGLDYTWDGPNKTVDVKGYSYKDKSYFRASHLYEELEEVAQSLDDLYWSYANVVNAIHSNSSYNLDKLNSDLNSTINQYNAVLTNTNNELNALHAFNLNEDSLANTFLNSMFSEIDYYKDAYNGLEGYSTDHTTTNWNAYNSNITKAINVSSVYGTKKRANELYNIAMSK